MEFIRLQCKGEHSVGGLVGIWRIDGHEIQTNISSMHQRGCPKLIALELIDDKGQKVILDSENL